MFYVSLYRYMRLKFIFSLRHTNWVLELKKLPYKFITASVILLGLVSNEMGCWRLSWAQTHSVPLPSREGWGGAAQKTLVSLEKTPKQTLCSHPIEGVLKRVNLVIFFLQADSITIQGIYPGYKKKKQNKKSIWPLTQSIILPSGLGTCHIGLVLRVFARWQNRLNVLNVFAVYSVWHLKSAS